MAEPVPDFTRLWYVELWQWESGAITMGDVKDGNATDVMIHSNFRQFRFKLYYAVRPLFICNEPRSLF